MSTSLITSEVKQGKKKMQEGIEEEKKRNGWPRQQLANDVTPFCSLRYGNKTRTNEPTNAFVQIGCIIQLAVTGGNDDSSRQSPLQQHHASKRHPNELLLYNTQPKSIRHRY